MRVTNLPTPSPTLPLYPFFFAYLLASPGQAAAHPMLKNYNPTSLYLLLGRGLDQFANPFVKANCHFATPETSCM